MRSGEESLLCPGGEGRILRFVFLHSIVLAALIGLLTLLQDYLLPWMIPAAQ